MEMFFMMIISLLFFSTARANELDKIRIIKDNYDLCQPQTTSPPAKTFREQINNWVQFYSSQEVGLELGDIYPYYEVKEGLKMLSLDNLNYCELNVDSLRRSLRNVPDQKTISLLNQIFINENQVDYNKLFSCLALEESLGDPDTISSSKIFQEVTGLVSKPLGVKFYIDKAQPKESALNIGLFQFTPNMNGNILPCVKSWNKIFQGEKNCQIKNNQDALKALSSSTQNFNTFCGVHKVIETAAIQMKSEKASAQFLPGESCVSLQMRAGLAYNHFGPFQNSTGANLKNLMKCVDQYTYSTR